MRYGHLGGNKPPTYASVPERPNGGVCKTFDSLVRIQPDAPGYFDAG